MKTYTYLDKYTNIHGNMSIRMNNTEHCNINRHDHNRAK